MDRKYLLEKAIRVAKLTRLIAKAVDLLIVLLIVSLIVLCFSIVLYPLGLILGIAYIALSDGLNKGQSVGKKFMGFAVKSLEDGSPCNYKQSAIRNLPFIIPLAVAIIPIGGWILGFILGLVLVGLELYLLYNLDSGHRLGDVMADTSVMANDDNFVGVKNRKNSWFATKTTTTI